MTNYRQGKIYKIVCNTTGLTYYGSTCEPTLARRLANHKTSYKCWKIGKKKGNVKSFGLLENDNYVIVLVELFPCDRKMELHQRERYYIENNDCVNKNIPTRTISEWYEDNREYELQYNANYRINNRDTLLEKAAQYLVDNREEVNKRKRERYLKNREKLLADQALYRANNKHIFRANYLKQKESGHKRAYQIVYRLKQKELKSNPPLGEITE
jgi:hypothetical protein